MEPLVLGVLMATTQGLHYKNSPEDSSPVKHTEGGNDAYNATNKFTFGHDMSFPLVSLRQK